MMTGSSDRTWKELSQIVVSGAEYDSPGRFPPPECLEGTRVVVLDHIYGLLNNREKNRLIWLHGTAGIGKSAVAFTVAETMRCQKVREDTNIEKRLAGTFFFSRNHKNCGTTERFFATLAYRLARNFPSIRKHVTQAIHEDPVILDPNKSLRDQMEALFLRPLRKLKSRLLEAPPLVFVVDALDECTPETIAALISLLGEALRDPDLPLTHILLTSRWEEHIRKVIQKEQNRLVTGESSGEVTIISLDDADVDDDISLFFHYSFRELRQQQPDSPSPSPKQFQQLTSRAGRRFIVASTMMKYIDDGYNDPRDRFQLVLQLTNTLLPGTEVYTLYDRILSTCTDPKRAYQHLSIVAALADPLPMSQISNLLGLGEGKDFETTLMQLRSFVDIPTDRNLPVNICHSSVRDYVFDPSNCRLPEVQPISPHSLLALSSLYLMTREIPEISDIPESQTLLSALSALEMQSHAMTHYDPRNFKQSLAFVVQPLEPLKALFCLLWLRKDRSSSDRQCWLGTLDGCAWLQTQPAKDWLQAPDGKEWLGTQGGKDWLGTQGGKACVQTELQTQEEQGCVQTESVQERLQTEGGRKWLRTPTGRAWLQIADGREWLQIQTGREWLQTTSGQEWLQTPGGREWLQKQDGREWLQASVGQQWLRTAGGREWLQTAGGREWLQTESGRKWLQTPHGKAWQTTPAASVWVTMEEFTSTLEAISLYINIPASSLSPALPVVQQFKSLPDFLMFPAFLALKNQDHYTSALLQDRLPTDMEIINAMIAFVEFGNQAWERSHSAPDALKYASQNWAFHLSLAPNPQDDMLHRTFQSFWSRHLLTWLERQWCLKGLQSCLVVLSEGQKLAKVEIQQINILKPGEPLLTTSLKRQRAHTGPTVTTTYTEVSSSRSSAKKMRTETEGERAMDKRTKINQDLRYSPLVPGPPRP